MIFEKTFLLAVLSAVAFRLSRGVLRTADVCREKWKFYHTVWDIWIDFQGRVLAPGRKVAWISARAQLPSLLFGLSLVFIAGVLQNLVEEALLDRAKSLYLLVLLSTWRCDGKLSARSSVPVRQFVTFHSSLFSSFRCMAANTTGCLVVAHARIPVCGLLIQTSTTSICLFRKQCFAFGTCFWLCFLGITVILVDH